MDMKTAGFASFGYKDIMALGPTGCSTRYYACHTFGRKRKMISTRISVPCLRGRFVAVSRTCVRASVREENNINSTNIERLANGTDCGMSQRGLGSTSRKRGHSLPRNASEHPSGGENPQNSKAHTNPKPKFKDRTAAHVTFGARKKQYHTPLVPPPLPAEHSRG